VPEPTIIAVDWSGAKKTNAKSGIWVAVVRDGDLVRSEAVSSREGAVAFVQSCAAPVIAGFDFSFSAPSWFAREHGCDTVADMWRLAERDGERWLGSPAQAPFWRDRCLVPPGRRFRRCELEVRPAKSIFQLVGDGQVGAGSVRGMPLLAQLRESGFAIWPFDRAADRTAIEIYPSLLRKLAPHHDAGRHPNEHARDAVVSARVMWDHRASLATLEAATDPVTLIEGDVWNPAR